MQSKNEVFYEAVPKECIFSWFIRGMSLTENAFYTIVKNLGPCCIQDLVDICMEDEIEIEDMFHHMLEQGHIRQHEPKS